MIIYTLYMVYDIHTHHGYDIQPADFGHFSATPSNSVVSGASWPSIWDSKRWGPDRRQCRSMQIYAHTWRVEWQCWFTSFQFTYQDMIEYVYICIWYLDTSTDICTHPLHHPIHRSEKGPRIHFLPGWWRQPSVSFGPAGCLMVVWNSQVVGLPFYAFYLLPARFWELAAGVILYLFCALKVVRKWLTERNCSTHYSAETGIRRITCFVTSIIFCFTGIEFL